MNSKEIYRQATLLVKKAGTRRAECIAQELGIMISYEDSFTELLGMYTFRWNHRMMFLNSRLEGNLKNMVIAHELGHDQRHRSLAKTGQALKEFSLFRMKDVTEYEANAFASHILLDNEEVMQLVYEGNDAAMMSQICGVDINMLLIKLQEMKRLGYNLRIPMESDASFFKKIEVL